MRQHKHCKKYGNICFIEGFMSPFVFQSEKEYCDNCIKKAGEETLTNN